MNMSKHEMLEIYLDRGLVRRAYDTYKGLSDSVRRSLVDTPVFPKLHLAFSRETNDGNLASLLDKDYYAWRREIGQ